MHSIFGTLMANAFWEARTLSAEKSVRRAFGVMINLLPKIRREDMQKIKILVSELLDLFEDHGNLRTGYIDKQTGEILETFEDCDLPEQEELIEKIEQDPDRYLAVEPIASREAFQIMERFVEDLPDGEQRTLLEKVLSWKKPFSNFKDALCDMGDLRQQWFDFHDTELGRLAAEWLKREGVDAKFISFGEASAQRE